MNIIVLYDWTEHSIPCLMKGCNPSTWCHVHLFTIIPSEIFAICYYINFQSVTWHEAIHMESLRCFIRLTPYRRLRNSPMTILLSNLILHDLICFILQLIQYTSNLTKLDGSIEYYLHIWLGVNNHFPEWFNSLHEPIGNW